ncbi:MAG: TolC family protein, partial [Desulfobulbaceae bacterium]|nr:TolC family protein [Desulfobulbaceae bacterium]
MIIHQKQTISNKYLGKKTRSFLILIFSAVTLLGCAFHEKRMDTTTSILPQHYIESSTSEGDASGTEYWAALFADPELQRLITQALNNNNEILRAGAKSEQLEQLEIIKKAPLLPFIALGGAAGSERQLNAAGAVNGGHQSFSLAASYEIDLWNKLENSADSASLITAASKEELQGLRTSIIARTTEFYYLIAELRNRISLHKTRIAILNQYVKGIEIRYRQGITTPAELYQARKDLFNAQAAYASLSGVLAEATHKLAVLLGNFPDNKLTSSPTKLPTLDTSFIADPPAKLLENRPDIRASFLRLQARDRDIASAVAGRYPSFNLSGQLGMSRVDFGTVISGNFWNLLLSATQPLWDGNRIKARVAQSKAAYKEFLADYHHTVLVAFQEAEDGLSSIRTHRKRYSLLKEQLANATQATVYTADLYRTGIADSQAVDKSRLGKLEATEQLLMEKR